MKKENAHDFFSGLNKVFEVFAVMLLFLVILAVITQVFFRYVLKDPLTWIEEVTRILFIWMIFIGSAVAHVKLLHPRVDFFIDRMDGKIPKRLLKSFTSIFILFFLVCMFVFGMSLSFKLKHISMSTTGMSLLYMYITIPISAAVMIVNQVFFFINDVVIKEKTL